MKNLKGTLANFNHSIPCQFKPEGRCGLCGKTVSRNRAVILNQPRLTMCVPCHEKHLDNMLALTEQQDKRRGRYFLGLFGLPKGKSMTKRAIAGRRRRLLAH